MAAHCLHDMFDCLILYDGLVYLVSLDFEGGKNEFSLLQFGTEGRLVRGGCAVGLDLIEEDLQGDQVVQSLLVLVGEVVGVQEVQVGEDDGIGVARVVGVKVSLIVVCFF